MVPETDSLGLAEEDCRLDLKVSYCWWQGSNTRIAVLN